MAQDYGEAERQAALEQAEAMRAQMEAQAAREHEEAAQKAAQAAQEQAEAEQKTAIMNQVQAKIGQIEGQCRQDPYACSCDGIYCDDILDFDSGAQAQEAYDKCLAGKRDCETQRQAAIREIEETKARIEEECRKNILTCNCDSIENENGRKECELAIIEAKYQAEQEKQEKIKICTEDLDNCDCLNIADEAGQAECNTRFEAAKELKAKIETACRENPINCDCSEIESESGRLQCEEGKKQGLEEAENSVKEALSKCFKDVEACNCSALDLPEESYVSFCEIQKTYGLNCKHEGTDCDKLENVEIYPAGMPAWLGKFFAKDYSAYIEKEKQKGAKEAAGIIQNCLDNPETCQCEKTPTYAQAFCEKNKALQIKCQAGDYDACIILDETPNLPEGIPEFSYSILDNLVGKLRNAKKQLIQSNAARKVGDMILACMDNASQCDCSLAPAGAIKSFCLHKQELVGLCREQKNYEACFTLDEEVNYPIETPDIIKSYIQKNVEPQINKKKEKIFNEMKQDTVCEDINTLDECREVYYSQ